MTKTKNVKRSLLLSGLALLMCVSMLIGSTFAWFSDAVTSNNNIITSGNLDAELYWSTDATNWNKVKENTNVFDPEALWEPGHTEVVYLKVVNEGTLAFKYHLGVNIISETMGINVDGDKFKLSNYIEFGAVETNIAFANRDAARAAVTDATIISSGYSKGSTLMAKDKGVCEEYVALVVYMPETVGNEANYKTGTTAPNINLGINLVATQYTYENDSYGDDYDVDALPVDVIATPENIQDVLDAAKPGDVIGLADGEYYDMSIVIPCDDITLVSNTAIVDHINVNGKKNVRIIGITFDAYKPQPVKDPKNGTTTILANITSAEGSKGAENLQIINCKFTNLYNASTDNYCPITVYDRQRVSGASNNITIDGCTFDTSAAYYVYMYYPGDANIKPLGDIVIKNNIFGNVNTTVGTAVYVGSTRNSVTVVNNIFTNNGIVVTPHNNASCTYSLKITVANNNFINTTGADLTAIGLRNFYDLPNCNTDVEGNVANYGASKFKAPYVDGSEYECYDVVADSTIIAVPQADAYNPDGTQSAALKDALKAQNATVILGSGDYGSVPTIGEGTTVIGTEGTVFASNDTALNWNTLNNATFKNITFCGNNAQRWNYAKGTVVFENCTFEGKGVYAIHYDGLSGADIVYKDCTIIGWAALGAGANSLTFDGCTIYGNGNYGLIRVYSDTTIKNCTFDVSAVNATDVYQDGIHAIDCTITVENCTNVNGAIEDIFNVSGTGVINKM